MTNRDAIDFLSVTPTPSMDRTHAYAQSSAHAFGDLPTRERLIQDPESRLDCRVDNTVRHAFATSPAYLFLGATRGAANKDGEILGRYEK
jgi:hypothetical protein